MKRNQWLLFGCGLVLAAGLCSLASATQSSDWTREKLDDPKASGDIGFAYSPDGYLSIACPENVEFTKSILYYYQEKQTDNSVIWKKETALVLGTFLGVVLDTCLDFDSSGGAGIVAAAKGVAVDGHYYPADMAIVYLYKPKGGTWGAPQLVYHYHMERGSGVAIFFSTMTLSFKFDAQKQPIIAFINDRYDIDDEDNEWHHASVHYAVGNQIYKLEPDFSVPTYGYPYYCGGYTAVDLDTDASDAQFPYSIIFPSGQWQGDEDSNCDGEDVLLHVKANASGVYTKTPIAVTRLNKSFGNLAMAIDSGKQHVAFETYDGTSQRIYYMSAEAAGAWSMPVNVATSTTTTRRFLGGLAVKNALPHLSIYKTNDPPSWETGDLFVINGPDWPANESGWVQVNNTTGLNSEVVSSQWRCRIAARPSKLDFTHNIAVAYQTTKTDLFQYSKCMVATGCAGTQNTTVKSSFSAAGGDLMLYALSALVLTGCGVYRKRSNKR